MHALRVSGLACTHTHTPAYISFFLPVTTEKRRGDKGLNVHACMPEPPTCDTFDVKGEEKVFHALLAGIDTYNDGRMQLSLVI